jgi:hypothetical protein
MTVPAKQQQTKGRAGQKRRLLLSRRPSRPMANRYVTVAGWSTHPARPVGWRPLEEEKNERPLPAPRWSRNGHCVRDWARSGPGWPCTRLPRYGRTADRAKNHQRPSFGEMSADSLPSAGCSSLVLSHSIWHFIQTISDGSSGSCAQPVRHLFSPNVALQHLTALPYFCRWNRPTWLPISSALKPRPFGLGNAAPLPTGLLFFVPRRLSVRPLHMQSSTLAAPFNIPSA